MSSSASNVHMRVLAALCLMATMPAFASEEATAAYKLDVTKSVKVKKGAAGKAHVEVVPREDAHVDPNAPLSLTVSAPAGVKVAKEKFARTDGKETAKKGVEFDVPFTATASGELKGKLNFYICTAKLCERQSRELATAVEVE